MERCVLVVEDNEQAAKLFALYLSQAGYRVVRVASGEEALALAPRLHPMAVVLDLILPGIDGWDVLSELKGSRATREIPVVIVSVLDRQNLGFQLGAFEHLVKPVEREQLVGALERSLAGENALRRPTVVVVHAAAGLPTLRALFEQAGYRLYATPDGRELTLLVRRVRPDLVVIELPGEACLEAIAELRSQPETSAIPMLVLKRRELPAEQEAVLRAPIETVMMEQTSAEEALVAVISRFFATHERRLAL